MGVAVVVLAVAGLVYARGLTDWLINDDEEGYLYAAWRVSEGDVAYRDFLTPQLPAFLYPGAVAVRLAGRDAGALRALAIAMVLVAGAAVFATGKQLLGAAGGLAAMAAFLFHGDVAGIARSYRPEAFLLAATCLALCVFVLADARAPAQSRRGAAAPSDAAGRSGFGRLAAVGAKVDVVRLGYAAASVLFGIGLLTKLFAVLPWAGVAAYVVADGSAGRRTRRGVAGDLAALTLPGVAVVAAVMGTFVVYAPDTMQAVLGHHLAQGADRSALEVLQRSLTFYRDSYLRAAFVLSLVPLGVVGFWGTAGRRGLVVAWLLPTAAVFLVLQRDLFPERHLIVLLPAVAIAVAAGARVVSQLTRGRTRAGPALGASLLAAVVVPGAFDALDVGRFRETGTPAMASLVRGLTPPDGRFISDNPGLGFYAGRETTPMGAGMSEGATESGQITARGLLSEPAAAGVALVTVNEASQDGALADLVDYEDFRAVLERDFASLGHFWRHYQRHELYLADGVPRLEIDYGWADILAVRPSKNPVEAAEAATVDLVLATREVPEKMFTALLHLVGPDGAVWATGDGLLVNGLQRSSEEFEVGEVVAVPLKLPVPLGAPAGSYRLRVGLYDPETGARLGGLQAGVQADSFDVGVLEVVAPGKPGGRNLPALGRSGDFSLVDVVLPELVDAGGTIAGRFVWRADVAGGPDRELAVMLVDSGGRTVASASAVPGWPTGKWRTDDVFAVPVELRVPPEAEGAMEIRAAWISAGEPGTSVSREEIGSVYMEMSVSAGVVEVKPLPPPETAPPAGARPVSARIGPAELVAVEAPDGGSPDGTFQFTLFWRAEAPIERSFTVLVHVVNAAGDVVAQADGIPGGGARPTTSWRGGEVVADLRAVARPVGERGPLTVLVGLYDAADPGLAPLPAEVGGEPSPDGRVPVATIFQP